MKTSSIITAGGLFTYALACVLAIINLEPAIANSEPSIQQGSVLSEYDQSIIDAKQAVQLGSRQKNSSAYLGALMTLAAAYQAAGQHEKAIATFQSALPIAEARNATEEQLRVMSGLGQSLAQSGTLEEAEPWLIKTTETAGANNLPQISAAAFNNLGNLLSRESKYERSMKAYQSALILSEQAGLTQLQAQAAANAARTSLQAGDTVLAMSYIAIAGKAIKELGPERETAYLLIDIAALLQDVHANNAEPVSNWVGKPYELLKTAEQIADQIQDGRTKSYAIGYMARLYLLQERAAEALTLTREAEFIAQRDDLADVLFRWQWQAGRILNKQGRIEEALAAYQQAVQTLQPIRHDVAASYGNKGSAFREIIGPLYFELSDLMLRRSSQRTNASDEEKQATLQQVRKLIEQFKAAELEDYFQDDCVTALRSRTSGIDQLEKHTAVVYPILLQDRLEMLVSLPQGIRQFTIPVSNVALIHKIRNFREKLEKRTTHQYRLYAKQLYDWLIAPISESLQSAYITTLVIVPDGALRTIPWAALHDGKEFLIQQYAIAYTPGLEVTDPRPLKRQDMQVLLMGISRSVQDFSPLPFVEDELNSIQKLYGGKILLNEDYRTTSAREELDKTPYSIVHIASHSHFSEDPEQTFLLAYDDRITMDKLEQFVGIGRFRDKPVELLTLSACQTAAGDDRAALGLAGVAVKSGARSALATLWFVNDQTTSLLVSEFYKYLKNESVSKAQALQKAQVDMLSDPRYRHPGYWSPYLLIGNWL